MTESQQGRRESAEETIRDLAPPPTEPHVRRGAVAAGLVAAAVIVAAAVVLATAFRELVVLQSFATSQFDLGPVVGTYSQSFRTNGMVLTSVSLFIATVEPEETPASVAFGIRAVDSGTTLREGRMAIPARAPPDWVSTTIAPLDIPGDRSYRLEVTSETPGVAVFLGAGVRDPYLTGQLVAPDGSMIPGQDLLFRLHATYGPGGLIGASIRADPVGVVLLAAVLALGSGLVGAAVSRRAVPAGLTRQQLVLATLITLACFVTVVAATYRLTEVA